MSQGTFHNPSTLNPKPSTLLDKRDESRHLSLISQPSVSAAVQLAMDGGQKEGDEDNSGVADGDSLLSESCCESGDIGRGDVLVSGKESR
jgi:hypothetical protein